MKFSDKDLKTRSVFDVIQKKHLSQKNTLKRLRNLLSCKDMRVNEDFFKNKICLDVGCGAAANGIHSMLSLGAQFVYGIDLTENFIPPAIESLSQEEFSGKFQLDAGSAENLPYPDNFFDFILCEGVLSYVENEKNALKEIYRCLKKGGKASITMSGKGGLAGNFLEDVLRKKYKEDRIFKKFIDNTISAEWIKQNIEWIKINMKNDNTDSYKKCIHLLNTMSELIDDDIISTIKDRVQPFFYHTYSKDEFFNYISNIGFKDIFRISREPFYDNIRKILAPMYKNSNNEISKIFYGDGTLVVIATK